MEEIDILILIYLLQQNSDDVDEDEESHHDYMDHGLRGESENTGSARSASVCEVTDNPGDSSLNDAHTGTKETSLSLTQLQCDEVKCYDQAASLDSVTTSSNPLNVKGGEILGEQMKEEEKEEEEENCGNVNLWSVVLKSMQPEQEEANEPSEAKEPLLPLLLKELHEHSLTAVKPQRRSSSELHTALLLHTQTELQTSQEDQNDISDTSVCDHVRTGYLASHTGTIDTENDSSEDEEEDCNSGYMTR